MADHDVLSAFLRDVVSAYLFQIGSVNAETGAVDLKKVSVALRDGAFISVATELQNAVEEVLKTKDTIPVTQFVQWIKSFPPVIPTKILKSVAKAELRREAVYQAREVKNGGERKGKSSRPTSLVLTDKYTFARPVLQAFFDLFKDPQTGRLPSPLLVPLLRLMGVSTVELADGDWTYLSDVPIRYSKTTGGSESSSESTVLDLVRTVKEESTTTTSTTETKNGDKFKLKICIRKMVRMDWLSKSDPLAELFVRDKASDDTRFHMIGRTEWVKNADDVDFEKTFEFDLQSLLGDYDRENVEFRVAMYDVDHGELYEDMDKTPRVAHEDIARDSLEEVYNEQKLTRQQGGFVDISLAELMEDLETQAKGGEPVSHALQGEAKKLARRLKKAKSAVLVTGTHEVQDDSSTRIDARTETKETKERDHYEWNRDVFRAYSVTTELTAQNSLSFADVFFWWATDGSYNFNQGGLFLLMHAAVVHFWGSKRSKINSKVIHDDYFINEKQFASFFESLGVSSEDLCRWKGVFYEYSASIRAHHKQDYSDGGRISFFEFVQLLVNGLGASDPLVQRAVRNLEGKHLEEYITDERAAVKRIFADFEASKQTKVQNRKDTRLLFQNLYIWWSAKGRFQRDESSVLCLLRAILYFFRHSVRGGESNVAVGDFYNYFAELLGRSPLKSQIRINITPPTTRERKIQEEVFETPPPSDLKVAQSDREAHTIGFRLSSGPSSGPLADESGYDYSRQHGNVGSMRMGGGHSATFGTRRFENHKSPAPGPGRYSIPSTVGAGKSITLGVRTGGPRGDQTPGPRYNLQSSIGKGAAVTIGQRIIIPTDSVGPSPGSYNIPSSIGNGAPHITIGQRLRERPASANPGPGSYADHYLVKDKIGRGAAAVTIGQRLDQPTPNRAPGPGAYDVKDDKGKSVTIGTRLDIEEKPRAPGPGAYADHFFEKDKIGRGAAAVTIGQRLDQPTPNRAPGPGAYDVKDDKGKSVTIGTRLDIEEKPRAPGPGAYADHFFEKDKIGRGAAAVTIGQRLDREAPIRSPGPGKYTLASTFRGGTAVTIGQRLSPAPVSDVPGPGAYTPRSASDSGKGVTIGVRLRPQSRAQTPGPGAYRTPRAPGKSVTILQRLSTPTNVRSPGPAQYDPYHDFRGRVRRRRPASAQVRRSAPRQPIRSPQRAQVPRRRVVTRVVTEVVPGQVATTRRSYELGTPRSRGQSSRPKANPPISWRTKVEIPALELEDDESSVRRSKKGALDMSGQGRRVWLSSSNKGNPEYVNEYRSTEDNSESKDSSSNTFDSFNTVVTSTSVSGERVSESHTSSSSTTTTVEDNSYEI